MSPMGWMATVWGVLTGVLVILLIYRSTLTMQEDEQLFLDDTKSAMEQEQAETHVEGEQDQPLRERSWARPQASCSWFLRACSSTRA